MWVVSAQSPPFSEVTFIVPLLTFAPLQNVLNTIYTGYDPIPIISINAWIVGMCFGQIDL